MKRGYTTQTEVSTIYKRSRCVQTTKYIKLSICGVLFWKALIIVTHEGIQIKLYDVRFYRFMLNRNFKFKTYSRTDTTGLVGKVKAFENVFLDKILIEKLVYIYIYL